jgi:hypothetical protein
MPLSFASNTFKWTIAYRDVWTCLNELITSLWNDAILCQYTPEAELQLLSEPDFSEDARSSEIHFLI